MDPTPGSHTTFAQGTKMPLAEVPAEDESIVWIDWLPEELRHKLAALVHGDNIKDAMNLANCSPHQQDSVKRVAMKTKVCGEDFLEWRRATGFILNKIDFTDLPERFAEEDPLFRNVRSALKDLKLEHIEIESNYSGLKVISELLETRSLSIGTDSEHWVPGIAPQPGNTICESLNHLRHGIRELKLHCFGGMESSCIDSFEDTTGPLHLPDYFPNVTSVDIFAVCLYEREVWDIAFGFQHLKKVTLHRDATHLSDEAIEFLQKLEEVEFEDMDQTDSVEAIGRIGRNVSKITFCTPGYHLYSEEVALLSSCTGLRVFRAYIQPGVEQEVLKICSSLRTLSLGWGVERFSQLRENIPKPSEGILAIARISPYLQDLNLEDINLTENELGAILKELGHQLRSFSISKGCLNKTSIFSELEILMMKLATYNHSLTSFCLKIPQQSLFDVGPLSGEDIARFFATVTTLRHHSGLNWQSCQQLEEKVHIALDRQYHHPVREYFLGW